MDTIRIYLDNLFKPLPVNEETTRLKNELLINMEEKYRELKADGRSENEAIGIVISEFGNIDELLAEMEMTAPQKSNAQPQLSQEKAENYIEAKTQAAKLISAGVCLCILGAAILIFLAQYLQTHLPNITDNIYMIPVAILLVFVGVAVGLFIYAGTKTTPYKFIEEGKFSISATTEMTVQAEREKILPRKNLATIAGVIMCIVSPIALFIFAALNEELAPYGVTVLLLIIAGAVFLLIRFASVDEAYKQILQTEDFAPEQREKNRVIGIVASIVWPLAVVLFLLSGFLYGLWHISWVIFVVTGILFGGFSAVYNAAKSK